MQHMSRRWEKAFEAVFDIAILPCAFAFEQKEKLLENVRARGTQLTAGLKALQAKYPRHVTDVRTGNDTGLPPVCMVCCRACCSTTSLRGVYDCRCADWVSW